ncbi:hypothetical protein BC828DRAFT_386049 [Blastocladiella britannica]|nr:hypothetical protein BC828DRAFT_386049 [Blastocladiella britannica]
MCMLSRPYSLSVFGFARHSGAVPRCVKYHVKVHRRSALNTALPSSPSHSDTCWSEGRCRRPATSFGDDGHGRPDTRKERK